MSYTRLGTAYMSVEAWLTDSRVTRLELVLVLQRPGLEPEYKVKQSEQLSLK